jgi:alpha-amylase/alpha-mannosidase (GH57 family)
MSRYICVHGHFYQPPRENPWLEAVEIQDSAHPDHDWNARIADQCYAPNAAARILDREGRIERIVNNYARISFDFGPTLLGWLETERPAVYRAVLAADRESRARFSGHGSALAQPYNHLILPLANRRDKETQIVWGLADFAHRFGRDAEGVWLPETAVDLETLELLAAHGVRFTVLAPHQAKRFRALGEAPWRDAGGRLDGRRAYRAALPSGRSLALFFYHGEISRAVAFDGLLASGETLACRLLAAFSGRPEAELVHIATDGESYGHHHRHGEMALAYALARIEGEGTARLTNYAEYLERHPPAHEVEIVERSSWSCVHGVERWRSDCGCATGAAPAWRQAWRQPLREALDGLRDALAPRYEAAAGELFGDPWAARDGYVQVLLDRGRAAAFLAAQAGRELGPEERSWALKLLELQRHALLMYTSCGWFFHDLAGIETLQILQYAGRAVKLAEELFGEGGGGPAAGALERAFLDRLARAASNDPVAGDGRRLYERHVRPAAVALPQAAAHYAVASLFEAYPERTRIFCYRFEREEERAFRAGRARLALGRVRVTAEPTEETARFAFAVLHFSDHNLNAGVRAAEGIAAEEWEALVEAAGRSFERADFPAVVRLLDRRFGDLPYSLASLFRDEQRRVLDLILGSTLAEVEGDLRAVFRHHAPLLRFLGDLGTPLPAPLYAVAEVVLAGDLRGALGDPAADLEEVRRRLAEASLLGVDLGGDGLGRALGRTLGRLMERLLADPDEPGLLPRLEETAAIAGSARLAVDLARSQELFCEALATAYPHRRARAAAGDGQAGEWVGGFRALGERLKVRVE